MKLHKNYFLLILLPFLLNVLISNAQYGHSPVIDSLVHQITDSTLSLLNRQLSGDTSVFINGNTDTIKSRSYTDPDNDLAAQFILQKFQLYGLTAYLQHYSTNGNNVIAIKPGTVHPEQQFVITAHYDSRPYTGPAPGADDNASGVCAILEAARLLSGYTFPYTIRFVAFDEEEIGLVGSTAYTDSAYVMSHQILANINLDMLAWDSNNDFECLVSTNTLSIPLMQNYIDLLRMYSPELSTGILINIGASDHWRFWNKGYPAVLQIEEYQGDYNAYYHTSNDAHAYVNHAYFLAMTRGAVAALATMAWNFKMQLSSQPILNELYTQEHLARLVITGPDMPDTGMFAPRLYYKVDSDTFTYINPFQSNGDTFDFMIPGFLTGSKLSYYFAAQDINGQYSVTLPKFGKGVNPPGSVAPPLLYSYYVLHDTSVNICASGLPLSIPANSTVLKTITVANGGRILDLNVKVNISHTNDKDINLFLISPAGREVRLSTKNGYVGDHYQNTVFDDEATFMINQVLPPYNGTYRPEMPLADFDDTAVSGTWTLKIKNTGAVAGSLTSFCLNVTFSGGCHYVDAALPVSGDGQTWETAFKSITEAYETNPQPGDIVLIKPGYYDEELTIGTNGEETVPLTMGVSIVDTNKVQFPAGTDLSGIDLTDNPGQYFVYIYRSRNLNNGFYIVIDVNDEADFIRVSNANFIPEEGIPGDSTRLSAAVGRPVIYRKYSMNPDEERVLLDSLDLPGTNSSLYIGNPVGDGNYDALPANFNIIDGLDLTGAAVREGLHLQSSSFNVVCNSRIYETDGEGIYINGNDDHPANYNIIYGNLIYNTTQDGIFIGANNMPAYNNNSNYNHILANNFHLLGSGSYNYMLNAIHVNDGNKNNVIERNNIHDFVLQETEKGAIEIHSNAENTIVAGNFLRNIGADNPDAINACILIEGDNRNVEVFNNIISDSVSSGNNVYAVRINGTGHEGSRFIHNTIYNTGRGMLLEDYSTTPEFTVANNIFMVNGPCIVSLGNSGRFDLEGNLYFTDPTPVRTMPYYNEPGRQVGPVEFSDAPQADYHLTINSHRAVCNSSLLDNPIYCDQSGTPRDADAPDIGAFELMYKKVWIGSSDTQWSNPANWNENGLPMEYSNVIIQPEVFSPVLNANYQIRGLLVKPGASLNIGANGSLNIQAP
jgi:subtilisin-like proprotein convertase family protein